MSEYDPAMNATVQVGPDSVVAYRMAGHGLTESPAFRTAAEAAAVTPIADYPPGTALLSLAARLTEPDADGIAREFELRRLVASWIITRATHVVAADQLSTFTVGTLPDDEVSLRNLMGNEARGLEHAGVTVAEALDTLLGVVDEVLDGRTLRKAEFSGELTRRVPDYLASFCAGCQVVHVSDPLLRIAARTARFCLDPRSDGSVHAVRSDQWLDPPPHRPDGEARRRLVRGFLRTYGPATHGDLGRWIGVTAKQARRGWPEDGELVPVNVAGRRGWVFGEDLEVLTSPPPPPELVLLPANDPFVAKPNRELLSPDAAQRRGIWGAPGSPGVVLRRGALVATWRHRLQGGRLHVMVTPFAALDGRTRALLDEQAARLGTVRDIQDVRVEVG
jgi:hypothetical protein